MIEISCKKCQSSKYIKSGFDRKSRQQRYHCKECVCHFTMTRGSGRALAQKLMALSLYTSGLSMNRIAKYFGVSTPAVLRWIKVLGEKLCVKPKPEGRVMIMELDEMWHYIGSKTTSCGYARLTITLDTSSSTGSVAIAAVPL